jgi:hypothetical protein
MRQRRLFLVTITVLLATALGVGSASAAPTHAKKSETFPISCSNGQTYTLVVNGNGEFSPGHLIISGHNELIPVAVDITASDETGAIVFRDSSAKPGQQVGLQDALMTCTFTQTEYDPESGHTFTITGTVVVFMTPRAHA